jgi:hypothetical protein
MRDESWRYKDAKPVERVSEEYLVPYINELDPIAVAPIAVAPIVEVPRVTNDYWFTSYGRTCKSSVFTPPKIACQGTSQKTGSIWVDQGTGQMYVRVRDGWENLNWGLETNEKAVCKP